MSVDQATQFVQGLKELTDKYKAEAQETVDTYTESVQGATQEFIDASHTFAKEMTAQMNQLTQDVQALYQSIYGGTDIPEEASKQKGKK